ncbi:MAG: helix-turn-helix transcriptional regulator, partial [Akkermansia sp.]
RLAEAMQSNSLTQKGLEQISNIPQSNISAYLKGKMEPKASVLYQLSATLGVSMEWLWGVDEPAILEKVTPANDLLSAKKEIIRLKNKLRSARKTLEGSYKLALEALKIEETEKEKK